MKPLALDLACGKGGWTIGLLAAGWKVIGFDIEKQDEYPGDFFRKGDIREITDEIIKGYYANVKLVVASPPCQEFSYRSFPFKRCRELAATVPPDKSIWEACVRIARECNAPLILENVQGAQKYMGKAAAHYGSYFLWGDVPALLPIGRPIKGFRHNFEGRTKPKLPNRFQDHPSAQMSGKSKSRKEWSANAARIPFELARYIGWCFYPK